MKIPKKEEGQGLVEYALLLVLVAIVIIAILTILGSQVMVVFARVTAGLNGQVITGQGKEAVITGYDSSIENVAGGCTVTISNISFVGLEDGQINIQGLCRWKTKKDSQCKNQQFWHRDGCWPHFRFRV